MHCINVQVELTDMVRQERYQDAARIKKALQESRAADTVAAVQVQLQVDTLACLACPGTAALLGQEASCSLMATPVSYRYAMVLVFGSRTGCTSGRASLPYTTMPSAIGLGIWG